MGAELVHLPNITRISIDGYELYPGDRTGEGLDFEFSSGPWIVLGVNGIGKSTLLLLLKYMITGPYRKPPAGFRGEGKDLLAASNKLFRVRVSDEARDALATIRMVIGNVEIEVSRRLHNLSMVSASRIKGQTVQALEDEEAYQAELAALMEVAHFPDALRVLEQTAFYLENKEEFLWSLDAQYEVFRALLTPKISDDIRNLEAEIMAADSFARNLNASLAGLKKRRKKDLDNIKGLEATKANLAAVLGEIEKLTIQEEELIDSLTERRDFMSDKRVEQKNADRRYSDSAHAYEAAKYGLLRSSFAGLPPSGQFIFAKLLSENVCPACGEQADDLAQSINERIEKSFCAICGHNLELQDGVARVSERQKKSAEKCHSELLVARAELLASEERLTNAVRDFDACQAELKKVSEDLDKKRKQESSIRKNLPKADQTDINRQQGDIERISADVDAAWKEKKVAEKKISSLIVSLREATEAVRQKITRQFNVYAKDFFADEVKLVYAPHKRKMGQYGTEFEFPGFEVEMNSARLSGAQIRRDADQVSLSQKDYLDIIFRFSVAKAVGAKGGTFLIDGPETAVDAVFAGRAGRLFSSVSSAQDATVILACNIVEGDFIPETLGQFGNLGGRKERLINLIDQGVPTNALSELGSDYRKKVNDVLRRGV